MRQFPLRHLAFMVAFLMLIFVVPIAGFLTTDTIMIKSENRNATTLSTVQEALGSVEVFAVLDAYLADQFGFRLQFIKLEMAIKSIFPSNYKSLVYKGKNEWHYLRDSIKTYEGSKTGFEDLLQNIRYLREQTPENIPIFFVLVPNKAFVSEDNLPDGVRIGQYRRNFLVQMKNIQGVQTFDLLPILKESQKPTHMRYETHWNGWGAYIAYKAIGNWLNQFGLNLQLKDINTLTEKPHSGDLAKMVGLKGKLFDIRNYVVLQKKTAQKLTQKAYAPEGGFVPDFKNDDASLKLFLLHDSFVQHFLGEYLAESFAHIIANWTFALNKEAARIQEQKPDVVLLIYVDRHLSEFHQE